MSDVGAMVGKLIAAGCAPDVAAAVVAEVFTAGVLSAPVRRLSADETAEKRREKDRERKREIRAASKLSADNPQTSADSADSADRASSFLSNNNKPKKERTPKIFCPQDFQPSERIFAWAEKEHIPRSSVLSKAEDMKLWAQSTGEKKIDWDATLFVWLRRDAKNLRVAPAHGAKVGPSKVFVEAGTDAFRAWEVHLGAKQPSAKGGWYFESEYPPGHERAA